MATGHGSPRMALLSLALLAGCGGGGGSQTTSPVAPSLSLAFSEATVRLDQPSRLTWSASAADSCSASGAWSGPQPTAGSLPVSRSAVGSYSYTLSCSGPGGSRSASASLTVRAGRATDYYAVEDTGFTVTNDNPNSSRALVTIENLDLDGDGIADSLVSGPEFPLDSSRPMFQRQSVHVLLGGPTLRSGAALFPAGRPSYTVSNYLVSLDFNGDGRRDVFLPEFGADEAPFAGGQSAAWLSTASGQSPAVVQATAAALHGASAGRIAGTPVVFAHAVCCGSEKTAFLYRFVDGEFRIDRSLLPPIAIETYPDGSPYRYWTASAIADLDGDRIDDLVLGIFGAALPGDPMKGNYVAFGTANGWQDGALLRLPDPTGIALEDFTALHLSVVDVDGDARKDLVLGYTNRYQTRGIQILRNTGGRSFADVSAALLGAQASVAGAPSSTLSTLDLNADGCHDIVEPEPASLSPLRRGRILLNDCRGKYVVANDALEGLLSSVPIGSMFPFPDHTGRTSIYLPVVEFASTGPSGLNRVRYKKLTNLANLPTPANGAVVFD